MPKMGPCQPSFGYAVHGLGFPFTFALHLSARVFRASEDSSKVRLVLTLSYTRPLLLVFGSAGNFCTPLDL